MSGGNKITRKIHNVNNAINTAETNIKLCDELIEEIKQLKSSYNLDSSEQILFRKTINALEGKLETFEKHRDDLVEARDTLNWVDSEIEGSGLSDNMLFQELVSSSISNVDVVHQELKDDGNLLREWEKQLDSYTTNGINKNNYETNEFGELLQDHNLSNSEDNSISHCPKCGTSLSDFNYQVEIEYCPSCGANI